MADRVLVTGGAGFLGSHLARRLVANGFEVRTFDSREVPASARFDGVEYHRGDIRDPHAVAEAALAVDVVVHAAFAPPATPPTVMHGVNVGGMAVLGDAALKAGVRRLIVISSTIVEQPYRSPGILRHSPMARLNAYRSTRAAAELVSARFQAGGGQVAIVRPKTFLGTDRVGAFTMVFELICQGDSVLLPGSGRNRYQLLDVGDLAAGIELLVTSTGEGVYTLGASEYGTVAEDMGALIDHAGTGARLRMVPGMVARPALRVAELAGMTPLSEWYQLAARDRDSVVDISRAREELGWEPQKSNSALLIDAYDWYASRRNRGEDAPATHPPPAGHRAVLRRVTTALRWVDGLRGRSVTTSTRTR